MAHIEYSTISIHPLAPAKVALGAACNGCGVCCQYAPCPLGILFSGRRRGSCDALRWDARLKQYRCGAIVAPRELLTQSLPRGLRGLAPVLAPVLRRVALRWIAAGVGCDSNLEVEESHFVEGLAGLSVASSMTMSACDLQTENPGCTAVRHPSR